MDRETPLFTFKQIEAVYWIAKTGSFVNAA